MIPSVPPIRLSARNSLPARPGGDYVLYWMLSARRTRYNFGLQHALALAERWQRPLVVLEAIGVATPGSRARFHRFVLDGMVDNAAAFAAGPVAYWPYVEPAPGAGRGLVRALAERACAVVSDEFPCFVLPELVRRAAQRVPVAFTTVDSNGALPLRGSDRTWFAAAHFRRHLQRELPHYLNEFPMESPLSGCAIPRAVIPPELLARYPSERPEAVDLRRLPIDQRVGPVKLRGGAVAASRRLREFLQEDLPEYLDARSDAGRDRSSQLSPYLHFGQLGAHEVLSAVLAGEGWTPGRLAPKAHGRREGWWGLSPGAEAFLDQLVTWRELGFNECFHAPDTYNRYAGLPAWARATLEAHTVDPRPHLYSLEELAESRTDDPLWNAAQTQLREEGRIHNYLRMLWGKRVLEWTPNPEAAFETLVELNDRYALDGRDPNSYNGISWVLGRYDHPWPPERPIFGTVRIMKSANTARKMSVDAYLARYG